MYNIGKIRYNSHIGKPLIPSRLEKMNRNPFFQKVFILMHLQAQKENAKEDFTMENKETGSRWNDENEEWIGRPAMRSGRTTDTYGYTGSYRFRPLSPWAYVGYTILFSIPVIGWLLLIIFTFSSSNINRRCFARSYWCFLFLIVSFAAIYFCILLFSHSIHSGNLEMGFKNVNPFVFNSFYERNVEKDSEKAKSSAFSSPEKPSNEESNEVASTKNPKSGSSSTSVNPEFKEAMDSYELFFDKYIEFMKKYEKTNGDLNALADYARFMTQYADMMQKMEAIDDESLSEADSTYYLKVSSRIYKKLSEVSN